MKYLTLFVTIVVLSGCSSLQTKDIAKPSEVTLDNAMESVGVGLDKMLKARGEKPFGLIPSEVEVIFKVTASATDSSKLVIDLARASTPTNLKVETKVGGEINESSQASKENTITVKFVNVLTIPEKTLAYDKPDKLEAVLKAVSGNIVILNVPPANQ